MPTGLPKEPGAKEAARETQGVQAPAISLPKGGGAIRGMGEKFAANPVTGTGSMTVPIATSPGRSGFGPQLSLSYDSGAGNGPFGLGWNLSLPSITRKTDKGLPKYFDADESDVYILSGAEDLVPVFRQDSQGNWVRDASGKLVIHEDDRPIGAATYHVRRYRPRIEGLFARIERWTNTKTGEIHWRSISKDNITTWYGKTAESRIAEPADPTRIFTWLICQSYDDKGNAVVYEYQPEDAQRIFEDPQGQPVVRAHERNRKDAGRSTNRYLKRVKYGNRQPNRDLKTWDPSDPTGLPGATWMFQVVFDYGEAHYTEAAPDAQGRVFAQAQINPPVGSRWPVRPDPFSSYRAGFEVRTYRLCRRVLMFHHFPQELGINDCLVRSTEFTYAEGLVASFITAVTQSGFVQQPLQNQANRYLKKSLPPLEFEYSKVPTPAELAQQPVQHVEGRNIENLPAGLHGPYQWVDLDGEGLSGILTEQGAGWFYKRNLGALPVRINGSEEIKARFAPVEVVASRPALSLANNGQFMDLAGDGHPDFVTLDGPRRGFYERTDDSRWETFRAFGSFPNLNTRDPNLRFVDLDGDGRADILISEDEVLRWYPSLAEDGFGSAETVRKPFDEEKGPALVFADGSQSIYLADMSGDGLTDLVRISNGEVCYWPNLGYGRFGAKVTMDNAPWFDPPDLFNQDRIRLADLDGSGTTDIIYLQADGARIYFNQSGNGWSNAQPLATFPRIDNLASVQTVDLLGNGTICLVWSSPLPGDAGRQMRYLDLMGGQKPHLLIRTANNLGAETIVTYAPSTKFYLKDRQDGKPWISKLPFPVHVVERVETLDHISRNRFITRHAYHHGYFDGEEREFRGFGMVEQWDTEELGSLQQSGGLPAPTNIDQSSYVPPKYTKTWFHTGICLGRGRVADFFAGLLNSQDTGEYFRESGMTDAQAKQLVLDDTLLPAGMTAAEECEACRALKGAMLRQEVYALDGTEKEGIPYAVTEQNFTLKRLQARESNRHAVFLSHPREAISYHYERSFTPDLTDPEPVLQKKRKLFDPRVAHTLTIEVDSFGNVLKSAAIAYGRRRPDLSLPLPEDQAKQTQALITYTENRFTNAIDSADDYRTPLSAEARSYELTGLTLPTGQNRFALADLLTAGAGAVPRPYEQAATPGLLEKRLIEHVRTLYRPDDLGASTNDPLRLLPLTFLERLALPGESYKLAFTPGLVTAIYGARVTNMTLATEGRYVHTEGDANWWVPAGRVFYSLISLDTPTQELTYARQHFFLPCRFRDPFHTTAAPTETFVNYDGHDLLMTETRDALTNRTTVGERDAAGILTVSGNDYRVLQPRLIMDPNGNRTEIAFDALGLVVGTAVMGKPLPDPIEGDSLSGFDADPSETVLLPHLANPLLNPQAILQRATTRMVYDVLAYQQTKNQPNPRPTVVYTLARETHDADPLPAGGLKIQHSFSYSDGFGREIQRKIQAEPGPVPKRDGNGAIIVTADGQPDLTTNSVNPRWVGSGWTVFNNKGKPVRQYEPFFTDTHRFEFDARIGVSPVLFYDPVERVVATLRPDHTWEKVVFDAWRQETWDLNDTVIIADPKADRDAGSFFVRLPTANYLPTWHTRRQGGILGASEQAAARKAAVHAGTPTVAHADSLGRTFLTIAHNKSKYSDTPAADPPVEKSYPTRIALDIEGNHRAVRDAVVQNGDLQGRVVVRYDYDMLGNRIHQRSMEAGERWMLNDIADKQIYAWDSRNHQFRTAYDQLRRPTGAFLLESAGTELQIGRTAYGEAQANPEASNLRGKVTQVFDQAGVVTTDQYDFKGNLRRSQRQMAELVDPLGARIPAYKTSIDWSGAVQLEAAVYTSRTRYDALNRPTQLIAPHSNQPGTTVNVIETIYNEANLLDQIHAWFDQVAEPAQWLDPTTASLHAVTNIDYDAKGQRTFIRYGNGAETFYRYDPETFRLRELYTRRGAAFTGDCENPQPPPPTIAAPEIPPPGRACGLQYLGYTYDAAGNICHVRDQAQQTVYFRNRRAEPSAEYTYDAIYRLIEATGREHLGQIAGVPNAPTRHSYNDASRVGVLSGDGAGRFAPNDGNAMGTYLERYRYDEVGNLERMQHRGSDPVHSGWTRDYSYSEPSQLEFGKQSNRLTSTTVAGNTETYSMGGNGYDAHGNILDLPQLQIMQWDFKDQLCMTQRQAVNLADADGLLHQGERTWYVYDANGQRARKVTETAGGQIKDERIYLGGFEIFLRQGMNRLARETLHIMDGKNRVALIETRTQGNEPGMPRRLVRFQFGNHLGSAILELDDQAEIISYEEYTPYGSTAYQAVRNETETPKRYRYTSKERDQESGLYYHGARYYSPWIRRWVNCDPAGLVDGTNLYKYGSNNPINLSDPTGHDPQPFQLQTPSLLNPRSAEDRRAARLAGSLVPPLRSGPPPNLSLPGAWNPSSAGSSPPPASAPPARPNAREDDSRVRPRFSGSLFPPRLQFDYGPLRVLAETSAASARLLLNTGSLTLSYPYGKDISLTARGESSAGSLAVNPSNGLTTFGVESTRDGVTRRFSLNSAGAISTGVTAGGFTANATYAPAQQRFELSIGFGGTPAPIYSPGYSGRLLPELNQVANRGVDSATDLLLATPGVTSDIIHDPRRTLDIVRPLQGDIGNVVDAAKAGVAIADVPRNPVTPDVRFRFNLSYSPLVPPLPSPVLGPGAEPPRPTGGLEIRATIQVSY